MRAWLRVVWRCTPSAGIAAAAIACLLGFEAYEHRSVGAFVWGHGIAGAIAILYAFAAVELARRPVRRRAAIATAIVVGAGAVVLAIAVRRGVEHAPRDLAGARVMLGIVGPMLAFAVNARLERRHLVAPQPSTPLAISAATLAARGFALAAIAVGACGIICFACTFAMYRVFDPSFVASATLAAGVAFAVATIGLALGGVGLVRLVGARLPHVHVPFLFVGGALVTLTASMLAVKAAVLVNSGLHRVSSVSLEQALTIAIVGRTPTAIGMLGGSLCGLIALGRYSRGPRFVEQPPRLDGRVVAFGLLAVVATVVSATAMPADYMTIVALAVGGFAATGALIFASRICGDTATTLRHQLQPPVATVRGGA